MPDTPRSPALRCRKFRRHPPTLGPERAPGWDGKECLPGNIRELKPPRLHHQSPRVTVSLAATFWEIVRVPFQHGELIWGIVPLYFSWMVTELTAAKVTYNTALQTGFTLLWAGAHWLWQAIPPGSKSAGYGVLAGLFSLSGLVTGLVLTLGALALVSGMRHKYPRGMRFLGHTRFAGYFMIALFPIQAGILAWTWERVAAIALFSAPVWLLVHLLLLPLRKR